MLSVSSGKYRERPDSKKGRISLQWLKLGSCFMSKDEGISESPVEIQEETLVPRLIWTGGLKSVDTLRGSWSSMLER